MEEPALLGSDIQFEELRLAGAFVLEPKLKRDQRGFFARTWCAAEFNSHGLSTRLVQASISFSHKRGTLRGLHYQIPPRAEVKLIRCTAGAIYDVIVDLRRDSPTYKQWSSVELTAANRKEIYVPEGFAHGFQTLEDDTEILYQMSEFYDPTLARGVRWNDPAFAIAWPLNPTRMSERDEGYEDWRA